MKVTIVWRRIDEGARRGISPAGKALIKLPLNGLVGLARAEVRIESLSEWSASHVENGKNQAQERQRAKYRRDNHPPQTTSVGVHLEHDDESG